MSSLDWFERIVRRAAASAPEVEEQTQQHPFEERNIHPDVAQVARTLFDNAHYAQATFEVYKYIDNVVSQVSGVSKTGYALMMDAFNEKNAQIKLTNIVTGSEVDEQMGFKFLFAGATTGIRNPRGHEVMTDPIDVCLDHLSLASLLLRRLDDRVHPL